jgi:general secretion pathway protein D
MKPSARRNLAVWALCLIAPFAYADNRVTLNFVNAEIDTVVRAMGQITGKNFLLDPRVKGTINISSVAPVSADLAYQILISSLRMQGFTAVEGKGVVKIVPEADAKQHFSQTYGKVVKSGGDQVVTQVYPLQHATAAQLVTVLRPLIAPNNAVSAYPGSNTLVITDYAENLKRLTQIIEAIDKPNDAEFNIIKVKHLSAIELAQQLSRLFADPSGAPASPGTAGNALLIAADGRSNSLLVRTDNQGKLDTLRTMVAQLDTPSSGMSNLQVIHLRNADATKLAETLRQLATNEARAATLSGSTGGAVAPVATGGINGVTILADAATNSLVINAPDHLYNNLRAVIDKLDAQRAQIFVEALIVEITSDKAAELGVQWMAPVDIGGGNAVVLGSILSSVNPVSLALNPTSIGRGMNLGLVREFSWNGKNYTSLSMLARALQSDTEANVLSTPNLLTLDNEEAKIVIGQNVPFITGSYAQSAATGSSSVNPFQTIERKDVGITLKVKPLIVEGGMIKMNIMQEASSVQKKANASEVGASDLITNKRTIETTVLVEDGKAVVLGGLIQDDVQISNDKVPGLGDLPLIGGLFRSESRARVKTNLMVFLRPVIVNTPETMANLTQNRYDYMRGLHSEFSVPKRTLLPNNAQGDLPDLKMDSMLIARTPSKQPATDVSSKPKLTPIQLPVDAISTETPKQGWFE